MFRKCLQFETLEDRRVCALVIGPDEGYLERGALHPYVGWVETLGVDGAVNGRASGVLISSHWVITAAHVEQQGAASTALGSFKVGFGPNSITHRGETQSPNEAFVHPQYGGTSGRGYDLALFYFDTPFYSVTPVTRFRQEIAVGDDSDIVGYGLYQLINSSLQTLTGDRRAGNNVINSVAPSPDSPEYVSTRIVSTFFPDYYRELQMGGRPGDSGGALIVDGQLAGITSTAGSNGVGSTTTYSRLDNAWIDATIASKANKWQNEASPLDVNADGSVSAIDALLVINFLNTQPGNPPEFQQPYLDVTGDDAVTAIDALFVINALNLQVVGEGEANDSFFADEFELERLTKLQSLLVRPRLIPIR